MKADITQQKCAICLDEYEARSVDDQCVCKYYQDDIFVLPCSHKFHISCLSSLIGKKTWAKCPICSTIFGKMTGDQPQGTIKRQDNRTITLQGNNRPGCIIIYYNMMGGVRNGVNFSGTSRKAYLPNTDQGKRVYKLLKEAFDRKLIFTVGRSVTSGLDNQTVWNGIHHKTTTSGGAASFGYPDPTYLQRVTQQLAAKGVTFQSMNKE